MSFSYQDVKEAWDRIQGIVPETPLAESFYLGNESRRYFFKLECLQRAKSFKIRGAVNKISSLSEEEKLRGIATISSGNHGSAVSYAATLLGVENAHVIVPSCTPKSKTDKIKYFGAKLMIMGDDYDEAHKLGMEYINQSGMTFIDAYYEDPKIYGGQGTVAVELLKQNPDIDTIVVPIGGGGLITGIAVAAKSIKPGIRVVGVQTEACPAMVKSLEDNVFYEEYPIAENVCDSLVGGVGKLSYQMAREWIDDIIVVSEESIKKATSFLAKEEKYIAEPGSCTTVAAVQNFADRIGGTNIALIITGGNIDGDLLTTLLNEY